MEKAHISVLMSIYKKESPQNFNECMESIINQTLQPNEILLVEDGPLTDELAQLIKKYKEKLGKQFTVFSLKENQGLGVSLAKGVEICTNSIIARMDTDDIMVAKRLEVQYESFKKNQNLTIMGSDIVEFEETPNKILAKKNMPKTNQEICEYSKRRNPFNHMTVMFRKEAVLSVGNYLPLQGFEDYYLWVRLLKQGYIGENTADVLVFARTGSNMYARRGGLRYLVPGLKARKKIYQEGLANVIDFLYVSCVHIFVSCLPNNLRGWLYKRALRNS